MTIGRNQAPYRAFLKTVLRWDRRAKLYRLFRLVYANRIGPGKRGGYSAKLSVALTPRLFRWHRGYGEWSVTLLGIRVHHLRSAGGWIA